MSEYIELKTKIAELEKQAEEVRKKEVATVIQEIKAKMAEYMITVEDLQRGSSGKKRRTSIGEAKYLNPATGETWTGRGRKPEWLNAAIRSGRSMDEFLIQKQAA